MSDASYSAVSRRLKKLDVVDDDWVCDRLSDDEIDVPKVSMRRQISSAAPVL